MAAAAPAAVAIPSTLPSTSASSSQLIITTRLHISGLSPGLCSLQDLTNRFTPYASVLSISHWPPTNDALGKPRNWAFVTLKGTRERIRKCVNTLSGTVWKGSKVRIGEAKRDFKGGFGESVQAEGWGRLNEDMTSATGPAPGSEATEAVDTQGQKKRKKKRLATGREEQRTSKGQVITEEDVRAGKVWGWRLTPAGHLIRPLQMRPSHPLPPASAEPSSSSTNTASKTKRTKKSKESKKAEAGSVSRARNQIIDPTRYGAVHLSGDALKQAVESQYGSSFAGDIWVCEEIVGQEGKVRWVKNGGADVEEVQIPSRTIIQAEAFSPEVMDQPTELSSSVSSSSSSSSSSASFPESVTELAAPKEASAISIASQKAPSLLSGGLGRLDDADDQEEYMADGTFQFSPYNPEDDGDLSEGYNEDALTATVAAREAMPLAEKTSLEKERGLKVLKDLFGSRHLSSAASKNSQLHTSQQTPQQDDEDDDGGWWMKLKREQASDVGGTASTTLMSGADEVEAGEQIPALIVDKETETAALEVRPSTSPPPPAVSKSDRTAADMPQVKASSQPPAPLSRRSALLAQMKTAGSGERSAAAKNAPAGWFQPVQRYEPATDIPIEGTTREDVHERSTEATSTGKEEPPKDGLPTPAVTAPARPAIAGPTEVRMGSLKDMFRPQEGGASGAGAPFSLFGGDGLGFAEDELDEDLGFAFGLEEEEDQDQEQEQRDFARRATPGTQDRSWGQPHGLANSAAAPLSTNATTTAATGPVPFFFPRFDGSERDPSRLLLGGGPTSSTVKPFWRTETPQDLESLWSSRKVELTQDYKRRHREAVKKKRRKVVGSRRAGVEMAVGVGANGGGRGERRGFGDE